MEKAFLIYEEKGSFGVAGISKSVYGNKIYRSEADASTAITDHIEEMRATGWEDFFNEETKRDIIVDSEGNTRIEFFISEYELIADSKE